VSLVHDHAAEAEITEPAHVAVEHLVVEHDNVGEAVGSLAVALHHGGRAVGVQRAASRAQLVLTTFGTTTSSG